MDSYLTAIVMTFATAWPEVGLLAATADGASFLGVDWELVGHWTGVVVKVIVGLGAVIFVHELGHFLVAKACGVRCDKFYVGFDVPLGRLLNWLIGRPGEMTIFGYPIPRTIGPRVKWGETEYGIGILPLGGYVKMLGQDDDPAHIAEQMQKSQVDAASANGVEVIGPNGEKYFVDRRSYVAKSVPQRMAIISAGVTMNIIFAFIFAVIAYGMGVPYMPSIVSETVPGSPAYEAGIEPGDQFIEIGKRRNPTFNQLRGGVTLGDPEGIPTVIRRADTGEDERIVLKPDRGRGLATIGIISPRTLTLAEPQPTVLESPAEEAKLISPDERELQRGEARLQGGDEIAAVGDVPVQNYREFAAELAARPHAAITITVHRPAMKNGDVAKANGTPATPAEGQRLTFEVPPRPMRDMGLIMQMGAVESVQADSPASAAGLEPGDVIVEVDGRSMASADSPDTGWDATKLPEYFRMAAAEGREVELSVLRGGTTQAAGELQSLRIAPRKPITFHSQLPPHAPMPVPSAGFAYGISNEVAGVLPAGPAAKTGIRPSDRITGVRLVLPQKEDAESEDTEPVKIGGGRKEIGWPAMLTELQSAPPGSTVELSFERPKSAAVEQAEIALEPVAGAFVAERGFVFEPIERIRHAETFAEQVELGWEETVDSLTMVYRFLQKIGTQVPITALGGPITIAKAAGYSASAGIPTFLVFLTMLSANLAVVNFLPIPLLDGGHMVFLAYEGVRGRPANEKIVGAMHMAGFVFIVSLMLFVLALDLEIIDRGL